MGINYKEFFTEVLLSTRSDYIEIGSKFKTVINSITNARKFVGLYLFKVNGKDYYCSLIMRDRFLEPHFGVFVEDKLTQLLKLLKINDYEGAKKLVNTYPFIFKDGYTNDDSDLIKILSYVFSILKDKLSTKQYTEVKIMGVPKKFKIYKRLVEQNIKDIPYSIYDEIDDEYTNKFGDIIPAKALLLKYDFS